jgi:hypothetical protein
MRVRVIECVCMCVSVIETNITLYLCDRDCDVLVCVYVCVKGRDGYLRVCVKEGQCVKKREGM